ncbi:MAG: GNAT family N-acetyltransferase [Rhodospirillaceae bacterium]|nr:GNAT family N-acetyltransferase [Rhodospirillaceae bacterium]
MNVVETTRLVLRTWHEADFEPLCAINADPRVMEFFPDVQDQLKTKRIIAWLSAHFDEHGYTFFATEEKESGTLIGFVGLANVEFEAHFTPATEIGWRLGFEHWGKGYATEAAIAALSYGFNRFGLPEIVSFAPEKHTHSRRVMEKIGLVRDLTGGFDHPNAPPDSDLQPFVLYRLPAKTYQSTTVELTP